MKFPVVITGVGICSPLGHSLPEVSQSLINGKSGITAVTQFNAAEHPSRIAGSVLDIPCPSEYSSTGRKLRRSDHALLWTFSEALKSADLWKQRESLKIGIVLGLGCEWHISWEANNVLPLDKDSTSSLEIVRRILRIHGPAVTLSAACASGNFALALGRAWLRQGLVDFCLAGGADMAVTPLTLAGFGNLRALSRLNEEPTKASRPFDKDRDGFVLSEGAAMLVLERKHTADRRGISMLAEVAGFGATSDAHHMVSPCPDATAATQAIQMALADAQVNADAIDYVNAHGTGTPLGDICETKALHAALGPSIDRIPVSATKSMTGHLLTASASFEAIAGIVAMNEGAIPPTINLDNPDPDCRLQHVAHQAREHPINIVLTNSFGFGGSNTAVVLKRVA